jgi:hypothetical protein
MHGRGCSHDMGAGRNFWVSGATTTGGPDHRKRATDTSTPHSRATRMAAAVGQPAPEFSAKLASGTTVNMNLQPVGSLTRDGHQSVLLWFYPRASTPG